MKVWRWTGCGLLLTVAASAWAQTTALTAPQWSLASDSDGFTAQKWGVVWAPWYTDPNHHAGIAVQQATFAQGAWRASGEQWQWQIDSSDPLDGTGYALKLGHAVVQGHRLVTADGQMDQWVKPGLRMSGFFSQEFVESPTALTQGIHALNLGGGVEQLFAPGWTGVATLAASRFSDQHERQMLKLRLIWDALPLQGVNLQLSHREQRGSAQDGPRAYFNPATYVQSMAWVGWRIRHAGWLYAGSLGSGRQMLDHGPATPTHAVDVSATRAVGQAWFLKCRAGWSQAAGLQGPGYAYRVIEASLTRAF